MRRILVARDVEAAVKGGAVFAAGGGGWADHGRMLGTAAVNAGQPELVTMDEVPDDAWIATAAAIGAPASGTKGRTSSAPSRGCRPRCCRMSIAATAASASARAAASTGPGAPRKEKTER